MGIFCSPLSNEYLLAAEHFDLSRRDVVELCGIATGSVFGGEGEQERLRRLLKEFKAVEDL